MSSAVTDPVAALARLLADHVLRARFLADRDAVLDALGLPAGQRGWLRAMDGEGLERQAHALLAKRATEVARLLPATFARGGAALRDHFARQAGGHWPAGHARHLLDALAFADRLHAERHPALVAAERNALRFRAGRQRFALHCAAGLPVGDRLRPGLQLLLRTTGRRVREFRLVLAG